MAFSRAFLRTSGFLVYSLVFSDVCENDRCDNTMGHPQYLAVPWWLLMKGARYRYAQRAEEERKKKPALKATVPISLVVKRDVYIMTLHFCAPTTAQPRLSYPSLSGDVHLWGEINLYMWLQSWKTNHAEQTFIANDTPLHNSLMPC
jgi:hypothetical protein